MVEKQAAEIRKNGTNRTTLTRRTSARLFNDVTGEALTEQQAQWVQEELSTLNQLERGK